MAIPVWAPFALKFGSAVASGVGSYLEGRNQERYASKVHAMQQEAMRRREEAERSAGRASIFSGITGSQRVQPVYQKPPEIPAYEASTWGRNLRGLGTGLSYAATALDGWNAFKSLSAAQASKAGEAAGKEYILEQTSKITPIGDPVTRQLPMDPDSFAKLTKAGQRVAIEGASTQTATEFYSSILDALDPSVGASQAEELYSGVLAGTQKEGFESGFNSVLSKQRDEVARSATSAWLAEEQLHLKYIQQDWQERMYKLKAESLEKSRKAAEALAKGADVEAARVKRTKLLNELDELVTAEVQNKNSIIGEMQLANNKSNDMLGAILGSNNLTWEGVLDPSTGEYLKNADGTPVIKLTSGTLSGVEINAIRSLFRRWVTNEQITTDDVRIFMEDTLHIDQRLQKDSANAETYFKNLWNAAMGTDEKGIPIGFTDDQATKIVQFLQSQQLKSSLKIEELVRREAAGFANMHIAGNTWQSYGQSSEAEFLQFIYDKYDSAIHKYTLGYEYVKAPKPVAVINLGNALGEPQFRFYEHEGVSAIRTPNEIESEAFRIITGPASQTISMENPGHVSTGTDSLFKALNQNYEVDRAAVADSSKMSMFRNLAEPSDIKIQRDAPWMNDMVNNVVDHFNMQSLLSRYITATMDTNPVGREERARQWALRGGRY